jgi:hypothetical protein
MRLDDPELVAAEYADDARLRRRAAAYTGVGTVVDVRIAIVAAVAAVRPSRVLEAGGELPPGTSRASVSMSPFVANLPPAVDEPFRAHRANSIFIAEKAA